MGVLEADTIKQMEMNDKIQKYSLRWTRKLLETKLFCRNLIKGINTRAVPLVRYSGPFLKWTRDELKQMDQITTKLMTMHKAKHHRDDIDRLYVSRKEGGRGLASIEDGVPASRQRLEDYREKHERGLIIAIRNDTDNTIDDRMTITRKQKRDEKQLSGRFKWIINTISHRKTWTWLRKGNFKRETECLLIATQNNAIRTNHIKSRIDKTQQNSKCRLCSDRDETINHIINRYSKLAQKEYKERHDWVGMVIHREMCKKFKFDHTNKWYMHNPAPVLENDTHKLLWDSDIHTDHLISARRPYLIITNKKREYAKFRFFFYCWSQKKTERMWKYLGSVPGRVIPKTQKMVLDASLLNTQHYKVRIKGNVEQSRERVAPSPTPWCCSYRKGSLRVTLDYGRQLYLLLLYLDLVRELKKYGTCRWQL